VYGLTRIKLRGGKCISFSGNGVAVITTVDRAMRRERRIVPLPPGRATGV